MPRPSKIWRRKEDAWYYATIKGKQEKLSIDYDEALELFHKLKGDTKRKRPAGKIATTLEQVCNAFLSHAKLSKTEKTYINQRDYLQSLCDFVGKAKRVYDIPAGKLDEWVLSGSWGQSTQSAAKRVVIACMNFAVKRELILDNPFAGIERGSFKRKERILSPEEREKIRGVLKGGFKDFLFFLEQTGCRPFSEAAQVTAEMINWKEQSIPFEKHKNEKKGKRRVIYLPSDLLARLRQLSVEYPEGPLFRTQMDKPWSRASASRAVRSIERRAKIPHLNVYAWRHSYITDCLEKGMSPTIIGELVGNSARTIAKFYDHLSQKKDALREAAQRAVSGCGSPPSSPLRTQTV